MSGRPQSKVATRGGRGRRSEPGRVLIVALVAVAVVAGGFAAWTWWSAQSDSSAKPTLAAASADPARVRAGEDIYRRHCAACHGAQLEGQPNWRQRNAAGRLPAPPHDDSGHTWHHPDHVLFEITRNGMKPPIAPEGYESDMPGFGAVLDEDSIRSVLAFIASRWSRRELEHQARVNKAYRDAR